MTETLNINNEHICQKCHLFDSYYNVVSKQTEGICRIKWYGQHATHHSNKWELTKPITIPSKCPYLLEHTLLDNSITIQKCWND